MRKRDNAEARGNADAGATTLNELMRRYENQLIRKALIASQGSVTRGALLLGVSHQRLIYIMKSRHRDLLSVRTPVKTRKRSIVKKSDGRRFRQKV